MGSRDIAGAIAAICLLAAFAASGLPDATAAAARDTFLQPVPDMAFERRLDFAVGQALFERLWVTAPASTRSADGLGPLYNARSCQGCHARNGRGSAPDDGEPGLVLRLSVTGHDGKPPGPEPTYGEQVQDLAVAGRKAEGRLDVRYRPLRVALADGEIVELRKPSYTIAQPAFGPLDPAVMTSPRLAPPVIGLGLVARIPEADILAAADPEDADGDGISGRPNLVGRERRLGRFGWKAGQATLDQQIATALALDIGISSARAPEGYGDCTAQQAACRKAPDGNTPAFDNVEAPEAVTNAIRFYLESIAAPAARPDAGARAREGAELFARLGCAACHRPRFVTANDAARPELSHREIFPYSDFLLHDMGEGLADHRPEGTAGGREWRTPPLWGLGRTGEVNDNILYLHDGRARTLAEAILWHGGEAAAARQRFMDLRKSARDALLSFLESL